MVNYMNLCLWNKIVENGDFHTMPAPFGIKIFFFGQEFMICDIPNMRPKIGLFHDRYPHTYRARLQITMGDPHFSLISQAYVDYTGEMIPGEELDTTLQYGNPVTPNMKHHIHRPTHKEDEKQ